MSGKDSICVDIAQLNFCLKTLGWTKTRLAERADVAQRTISRLYEKGMTGITTFGLIKKSIRDAMEMAGYEPPLELELTRDEDSIEVAIGFDEVVTETEVASLSASIRITGLSTEDLKPEDIEKIQAAISRIVGREVRPHRIRKGSVIADFELNPDEAEKLKWAVLSDALAHLGIAEIKIQESADLESELETFEKFDLSERRAPAEFTGDSAQFSVAVVDDDDAVRRLLVVLLRNSNYVVDEFADPRDFLAAASAESKYDCILLDEFMEPMNGLATFIELRKLGCISPAIMVTGGATPRLTMKAIDTGFSYLLEKPIQSTELLVRIGKYCEQYRQQRQAKLRRSREQTILDSLSERERQVLRLLAQGFLNKQIASELGVGMRTVETYRNRVMSKIGATCFADAIAFAISVGLRLPRSGT